MARLGVPVGGRVRTPRAVGDQSGHPFKMTKSQAVGLPGQRHPKRRIFRSSPLREEGGVVADCVDSESMKGIAALRNRRVLAAQPRSSDNAVVGTSLLIER